MDGLLYANGVIKCKETALLGKDKITRMTDTATLADAVKVLTESGYAGGMLVDCPERYPLLIEKEREITSDTVKKLAPKGSGIELFFLENDYLDAKAALKNLRFGSAVPRTSRGVYGEEKIAEFLETEKRGILSEELSDGITEILNKESATPFFIDVTLDRKYYEEVSKAVAKSGRFLLREYFSLKADGRNLLSYLRSKRAGLGYKKFAEFFVVGGKIKIDVFEKFYDDDNALYELGKAFGKKEILEESEGVPSAFEKSLDEALTKVLAEHKSDMSSVAPLVHFLIAKETELKTVSVVLAGVANGVDKETIKRRVRDIYA